VPVPVLQYSLISVPWAYIPYDNLQLYDCYFLQWDAAKEHRYFSGNSSSTLGSGQQHAKMHTGAYL